VPLAERPAFAALGRGNRAQRMRRAARLLTDVHQRTAGVVLALREAAASEPDLARWRLTAEEHRRADIALAAELIAGRPVTPEECDGLWAVMGVEVYDMLTGPRGWSARQYEQWMVAVIDQLLPDPGGQR
jgi:hypothetical protein